ncbi:putative protein-like family protein [compost metagenome]
MSKKAIKISGWVLTLVLTLLFSMSAFMKLTQQEAAVAQAASIGINAATYQFIGIIEIISLILFIVPRTGILGTLLLAAYLGGAIVTHLQHQQPVVMAVMVQSVLWITAIIRFPELKHRLLSGTPQNSVA